MSFDHVFAWYTCTLVYVVSKMNAHLSLCCPLQLLFTVLLYEQFLQVLYIKDSKSSATYYIIFESKYISSLPEVKVLAIKRGLKLLGWVKLQCAVDSHRSGPWKS